MGEEELILGEEVKELNYKVKEGDVVWNVESGKIVVPFPTEYEKIYKFLKSIREVALESEKTWRSER